ncbi:MAG: hypothetical protein IJF56_00810 [Clostridia bacterium]|nr:hypothetical protein [Clostridia bacterium]
MKNSNRFSDLLKHLMAVAKLKNSVLAKALRYDESYISKWVTGALLPTEKVSEKLFREMSHCIVQSLDDEGRENLYSEYQVQRERDLEGAILDNLTAEYEYMLNQKENASAGSNATSTYYPELTMLQFMGKMRHPALRQVKSLDVILAADILMLDPQYQLILPDLSNNDRTNVAQFSFPGVRFSLLLNLDLPDIYNPHYVLFIQNLLTSLANIDFQLYSSPQSRGKIMFTVKKAYALSGLILDKSHCFSVTATEDPKHCDILYDKLHSLCNRDQLVVRHTTFPEMVQSNKYMQYAFSRNQRWVIHHVTEHILSDALFRDLATEYCENHPDVDLQTLTKIHRASSKISANAQIKVFLHEDGLKHFVITGIVDFFGIKMTIPAKRRLECLEHILTLQKNNPHIEFRIIRSDSTASQSPLPPPTLFLSDSFSYLRIVRTAPTCDLSVLCDDKVRGLFLKYYDTLAENTEVCSDTLQDTVQYLMQMVQILDEDQ